MLDPNFYNLISNILKDQNSITYSLLELCNLLLQNNPNLLDNEVGTNFIFYTPNNNNQTFGILYENSNDFSNIIFSNNYNINEFSSENLGREVIITIFGPNILNELYEKCTGTHINDAFINTLS